MGEEIKDIRKAGRKEQKGEERREEQITCTKNKCDRNERNKI